MYSLGNDIHRLDSVSHAKKNGHPHPKILSSLSSLSHCSFGRWGSMGSPVDFMIPCRKIRQLISESRIWIFPLHTGQLTKTNVCEMSTFSTVSSVISGVTNTESTRLSPVDDTRHRSNGCHVGTSGNLNGTDIKENSMVFYPKRKKGHHAQSPEPENEICIDQQNL